MAMEDVTSQAHIAIKVLRVSILDGHFLDTTLITNTEPTISSVTANILKSYIMTMTISNLNTFAKLLHNMMFQNIKDRQ